MSSNNVVWELDGHTQGKHLVLRNYMDAWLPIMTRWNGRVLFIDAFAGPGEYSGGEPGSPVIALRALTEHNSQSRMTSRIRYLFIESDPDRSHHLQNILTSLDDKIPQNCTYSVINSTFDETLNEVLNNIEEQNKQLAPSFVMIDPFGVSGTPMRTIGRILANRRSEVYVSFMYRDINRFLEHPNFEPHLDDLFGCMEWRGARRIQDTTNRRSFLYNLYKEQLRLHGAQHVLHFDLYEGNRLIYAIFFGTKHLEGCDKMKQAIWKVAPFGNYKFQSGQHEQLTFGTDLIEFGLLEDSLQREFGFEDWLDIDAIEDFMKSDKTQFHSSHLKTSTLKPMESGGRLEVRSGTRKRAGTYPKGTVLRFVR